MPKNNKNSRISTLTTRTERVATMYGRAIHGWAYVALAFWSMMLIVFTIVRLAYTFGSRGGDRFLNNGRPFYEPTVMELLISGMFALAFSIFMIFLLRTRKAMGVVSTVMFELIALGVLWMLWVGGAGSASTIWPDLNFCVQFNECRILQAMMAWAWLGWITITLLLIVGLFFAIRNHTFKAESHLAWQTHDNNHFDMTETGGNRQSHGYGYAQRDVETGPGTNMRNLPTASGTGLNNNNNDPNAENNYEFERWRKAVDWLQEEKGQGQAGPSGSGVGPAGPSNGQGGPGRVSFGDERAPKGRDKYLSTSTYGDNGGKPIVR